MSPPPVRGYMVVNAPVERAGLSGTSSLLTTLATCTR